ncbi:MAG: hypothetical protein HY289_13200 [Planctomycetes bacterium]|nr:hypothetical protein [Planctomycetota bacterium]
MAFYTNRAQIIQQFMPYTVVCLVMGLNCGAHLAIDADPARRFNYSSTQSLPFRTCEILPIPPPPLNRPPLIELIGHGRVDGTEDGAKPLFRFIVPRRNTFWRNPIKNAVRQLATPTSPAVRALRAKANPATLVYFVANLPTRTFARQRRGNNLLVAMEVI